MPRRSFTFAFKLSVTGFAEMFGNRAAGRHFEVDESIVRRWRSNKATMEAMPKNKKAMRGKSAQWPEVEERLMGWAEEKRMAGHAVSTLVLRNQAKKIAKDIGIRDFVASTSWASRFIRRHDLVIRRRSHITERVQEDLDGKTPVGSFQRFAIAPASDNSSDVIDDES